LGVALPGWAFPQQLEHVGQGHFVPQPQLSMISSHDIGASEKAIS